MNKTFTVTKCTPNKTSGFVWTLTVTETATVFGIKKDVKRTYYIGGMPQEAAVGTEFKEDLSRFEIVEREFITTETDGTITKMMLKWLHVKI